MNITFQSGEEHYEMVIPAIIIGKKTFSREEILAEENTAVRDKLVYHAWTGPDGRREEDEFDENGIFRLIYPEVA